MYGERLNETPLSKAQPLGEVTIQRSRIQMSSGETDMTVGAQEIERRLGNLCSREFLIVDRIVGNLMRPNKTFERGRRYINGKRRIDGERRRIGGERRRITRKTGLADHDQVKPLVIQLRK